MAIKDRKFKTSIVSIHKRKEEIKKNAIAHAVNRVNFVSQFVDEKLGRIPKFLMKIGPVAKWLMPYDVHEIGDRIYIVRRKDMIPVRALDKNIGVVDMEK